MLIPVWGKNGILPPELFSVKFYKMTNGTTKTIERLHTGREVRINEFLWSLGKRDEM